MAPVTTTLVTHSSIWEGTKIIIHQLQRLQKTWGKYTISHSYCSHHHTKWRKLLFSAPLLGEWWLLSVQFSKEKFWSHLIPPKSFSCPCVTKKGNGTRKCYTVRIYTAWCHQPLQLRQRIVFWYMVTSLHTLMGATRKELIPDVWKHIHKKKSSKKMIVKHQEWLTAEGSEWRSLRADP